jgi:hypothetical protein
VLTWLLELQLLSWVLSSRILTFVILVCFVSFLFCFVRTKAQPPIYYMTAKPLVEDATEVEQHKEKVVGILILINHLDSLHGFLL